MIKQSMVEAVNKGSVVRKMFEDGIRLKQQLGEENVFDFSLGNPDIDPPQEVIDAIKKQADRPSIHGYMPNPGHLDVRQRVAEYLETVHGVAFSVQDIVLTVGASGAINVALKSLVSHGDEVITVAPFFMEYEFYVANHGAKLVPVMSNEDFSLNVERIAEAINSNTRAIILNSPNNPSGHIYSDSDYAKLAKLIEDKDICIISDEPYAPLIFDDTEQPSIFKHFKKCFLAYSFSKALSLAGERIGYLAISPNMPDLEEFRQVISFANRTLGFVNAPSLFQRVAADFLGASPYKETYAERCKLMYDILTGIGYQCNPPRATFYLFPKSPIADDVKFCEMAIKSGIIVVPGTGFGYPGHFRISLCVTEEKIARSAEKFKELYNYYNAGDDNV